MFPFIVDISPDAYYGSYLNFINERFLYQNTGNAAANMTFRFYPDSTEYCGQVEHLALTYQVGLNSAPQPLIPGNSYPAFLMPSDTLIIIQQARDSSCIDSTCSALAHFYWQCNYGTTNAPALCDHCQNMAPTDIQLRNLYNETVRVERLFPIDNRYDLSCFNDTATMMQWEYHITNPGVGALDSVFISLNGAESALNHLTLVPRSSLEFIINCVSCNADSTIVLRTAALCDMLVPDPLAVASYTITDFHNTDTIVIRFRTFRCSEENNPALLNVEKYYNQWKLPVTAKTICGSNAVRQAVVQAGQLYYGTNQGISSHSNNSGSDITQNLIFTPSVTDLTVPPGVTFGDSTLMSIQLTSLVHTPGYDYQLFGYNGSWPYNAYGYIRATVHCDKGLRLAHPDSNARLSLLNQNTGLFTYINPVYFHSMVPDSCVAGDYYYYFDLSAPQVLNYFTKGQFEFMIQSCCTADDEKTPFDVTFHLMPNPDSCFVLNFSDTTHTVPPPCTGVGCTWLPLSSAGSEIAVHCPGCLAPGIIIDHYQMKRVSFGLQDSDNDGRADSLSAFITENTPWFKSRQQALKQQYSSFSDRLTDYMTAHFQAGDSTMGGYTYEQMLDLNVQLPFLQLKRTIPAGLDTMGLRPTGFTLYIDTPVYAQPNCFECDGFHMDTMLWRTQRAIHFTGNDVFQCLDTLTQPNLFFFTFESRRDSTGVLTGIINSNDPNVLHFSDSITPFTGFFEGQGYRLKVHYDVCGNFMSGNNDVDDLVNISKRSVIENKMSLSGFGHSTTGYDTIPKMINTLASLHAAGWTLDPLDTTLTLINDSFASSFLFYCETFGGLHYFHSQDGRNQSTIKADSGCTKVINIMATCRTAAFSLIPLINIYPFEYRPNALWPQEYTVTVPDGYHITQGRVRNEFIAAGDYRASNWRPYMPLQTTGTFTINDSIFPDPVCLLQSTPMPVPASDTAQYAGSRYTSRHLQLFIQPDSCAQYLVDPADTTVIVSFDKGVYPCLADSSCTLDTSFSREMHVGTSAPLLGVEPALTVQVTPDSMLVSNHTVCVTVEIRNLDINISPGVPASPAGFVFIALPDSASVPFLNNWMFLTANDTIYPANGQILQLSPSLAVGGNVTGQLCAQYTDCQGAAQVDFQIGWNCGGFPSAPFQTDSVCEAGTYSFQFTDANVQVGTITKTDPDFYTLCDTFTISAPFTSHHLGNIDPQGFLLEPLPNGLEVLSVVVAHCTSGIIDTLDADSLLQNFYPVTFQNMQQVGITDGAMSLNECIRCEVTLLPKCSFDGSLPDIILDWVSFCGVSDTTVANFDGSFLWDSTSQCTNCFTIEKTALQDTAFTGDTATFQIVVCGNNALAQTLLFSDQLPVNFTPVSTMPDSITVPAIGCDTLFVSGIYSQPGTCANQSQWNTATIYFAGDSLFSQACAEVYPLCAANITAPPIPDSSFTSSFPSTVSNHTLFLEGRLYVDNFLTLNNCSIFVNTGGQIITLPGGSLILDSTIIQGCDSMWHGMVADTLSSVAVTNGSTIRDADRAVEARGGSDLKITNSSFEDNVWGIYVPANSSGNNITHTIYGNRFGMFAPSLKPAYPGQTPFGSMPYAGIEVNDVVMTIGSAGADSNWFYNMNIGVIGHRSALKVVNNKFSLVQIDTAITSPNVWDGTAIASLGDHDSSIAGKLIVSPVTSGGWTIENCGQGVYTDYSDLDVRDVKMTQMQTGIFSTRCTDMLSSIVERCIIQANYIGIDWQINNGAANMTANSNSIYMTGAYTYGILMQELNTTTTANYSISGNYVEMNNGMFGITGMNLFRSAVTSNIVKLSGTSSPIAIGIAYEGGLNNVIHCNLIDGDNASDTTRSGIAVHISESTKVICNRTDETGFGVFFGGINPVTTFRGNTMIDHFNGLRLNKVAIIDTQSHAGNRWVGTYGNFGAVNMNDSTFTNLAASLFIVDPSQGATYTPTTPTSNPNNTGWFDIGSGTTFTCDSLYACHFDHEEERSGSEELMMAIAGDSTLTSDFIPETKAMAQMYLYEKLTNDTALLNSSQTFVDFKSEKQTEPTGYLYEAKWALQEANYTDSSLLASLTISYNLIRQYTYSIFVLDSLFFVTSDTSYATQRIGMTQTIHSLQLNVSDILVQQRIYETGKLNTALQKNTLVQPEEIPETNEKLINEVEVSYRIGGVEAISTYQNQILSVAVQCPFKGGKSVYRARVLLSLITEQAVVYDDFNTCASEGIYRTSNTKAVSESKIQIVPNPTNNHVLITLTGVESGVCNIDLYSSTGYNIINRQFNCLDKTYRLDIGELAPGLYLIRVNANGKLVANEKLIIHMGIPWLILLFLFAPFSIFGQGYNKHWFLGTDTGFAMGIIEFDSNSYQLFQQQHKMTFKGTEAAISDSNGNFLMSSNGVWIANANNDTMMNGGGLNPSWDVNTHPNGLLIINGNVFLPYPGDSNKYVLIHHAEFDPTPFSYFGGIHKSVIDITFDGGLGAVIQKNDTLIQDQLTWGLAAVKHGNGRDWWVIAQKDSSDIIYKILLTPNGVESISTQNLGYNQFFMGNGSQITFSQDGTKFIQSNYYYNSSNLHPSFIAIADFDRCTGLFVNTQTLLLTNDEYLWGLAFSPTGDYAYACTSTEIFQINTSTLSVDTVAVYDGFCYPNPPWCTTFWNMYLAANGKIYITSGNAVQHIHEMNYPDNTGVACDVQQHSIDLNGIWYLRAVPNHPNYYLGALTGSSCDTLMNISELSDHDFKFSVSPNPSIGNFKIMYLLPQNKKGRLELFDVNGGKVYEMNLPPWSTMQIVNFPESIASGVYNLKILSGGYMVNKKLVLVHDQ